MGFKFQLAMCVGIFAVVLSCIVLLFLPRDVVALHVDAFVISEVERFRRERDRVAYANPFDNVSLRLFYNLGRLPLLLHYAGARVDWVVADHCREHRRSRDGGWLCLWCGRQLPPRNRAFCNDKCRANFDFYVAYMRSWQGFRWRVFGRDGECCVACGRNISEEFKEKRRLLSEYYRNGGCHPGYVPSNEEFVCDHIVPLSKGGRDWWQDEGMLNFQTLCVECNKLKTAADLGKPKTVKALSEQAVVLERFGSSASLENHKLTNFMEPRT